MSSPKMTVVKSTDLGNDWRPQAHIKQEMYMSKWEQLKDIARRRRYHVNSLSKLDDEEKAIREEIDAGMH